MRFEEYKYFLRKVRYHQGYLFFWFWSRSPLWFAFSALLRRFCFPQPRPIPFEWFWFRIAGFKDKGHIIISESIDFELTQALLGSGCNVWNNLFNLMPQSFLDLIVINHIQRFLTSAAFEELLYCKIEFDMWTIVIPTMVEFRGLFVFKSFL
jgi:hypothetical protein